MRKKISTDILPKKTYRQKIGQEKMLKIISLEGNAN